MRITVALCIVLALCGVGPRVAVHGLGSVGNFPYSSPYEDPKLKGE